MVKNLITLLTTVDLLSRLTQLSLSAPSEALLLQFSTFTDLCPLW